MLGVSATGIPVTCRGPMRHLRGAATVPWTRAGGPQVNAALSSCLLLYFADFAAVSMTFATFVGSLTIAR